MTWEVPADLDGERADRALARLSGSSRAVAREALEREFVELDGEPVAPAARVAAGAVFSGELPTRGEPLQPEPVPFTVLYEDDDLAVVDKPGGIVNHPGAGRRSGTLAAGLLHRWPSLRGVGDEDRWGIVHRLDRETSGLLVVALTSEAHRALREAIKQRAVTREYLALVIGRSGAPTGTIEAPIGRDPDRPTRMRVHPDGRPATTHFRVEEELSGSTLLRVSLETGRTHQIRVHLASIGLPIAGDRVYGSGRGSPRVFLHAARLSFDHPLRDGTIDVSSDLPADLATVLDRARSGA